MLAAPDWGDTIREEVSHVLFPKGCWSGRAAVRRQANQVGVRTALGGAQQLKIQQRQLWGMDETLATSG